MNQQIQKLWDQAKTRALGGGSWTYCHPDERAERFAELIIQECIDCAVWVGKNNHNPVEPIHTAHAVKRRIKQHFGVEE
jgi:hypothetical protein